MTSVVSVLGVVFSALGLLFAWVKLKPSERRFAKKLGYKAWRASLGISMLAFFLWSNYDFLAKEGPATRFQIFLLIVIYAEILVLGIMFIVFRLFERAVDLQERMARSLEKASELALTQSGSSS